MNRGGFTTRTVLLAAAPLLMLLAVGFLATRVLVGPGGGVESSGGGDPSIDPEVLASMTIPEFSAKNQDGAGVDRSIFTRPGRYVVLNFIFTHCVTVCPITTGQMIRIQEAAASIPSEKLALVSFSVDPERDTPEALRSHASGFADFSRWSFLSADAATVQVVVAKGLGFALEEELGATIDLGGGQSMNNIVHPSKILLISPEGRVVGMFRGLDEDDVNRLIKRLGALR